MPLCNYSVTDLDPMRGIVHGLPAKGCYTRSRTSHRKRQNQGPRAERESALFAEGAVAGWGRENKSG